MIVTMRANLTESDLRSLIKGPSEDERAHAAHKICRCIDEAELSPEARAHAEGIIAITAQDALVVSQSKQVLPDAAATDSMLTCVHWDLVQVRLKRLDLCKYDQLRRLCRQPPPLTKKAKRELGR